MALSKFQAKMNPVTGEAAFVLNGVDVSESLLGFQANWKRGEPHPVVHLAIAVEQGDLDLFAVVNQEVAGLQPPPAQEGEKSNPEQDRHDNPPN